MKLTQKQGQRGGLVKFEDVKKILTRPINPLNIPYGCIVCFGGEMLMGIRKSGKVK